jgi:hypothetical protein
LNIFGQILVLENPANNVLLIIVTDFVTAFIPSSGGYSIIGFHTAQTDIVDPAGILVWTWAAFLPQSNDPFAPGFLDVTGFGHELAHFLGRHVFLIREPEQVQDLLARTRLD